MKPKTADNSLIPELSASSLERLVPDQIVEGESTGLETLELHLERYRWAANLLRLEQDQRGTPGRLLDCACGVGYGSALLAEALEHTQVHGVDIDAEAVRYATTRYADSTAQYSVGDLCELGDPASFDALVSLETIEHVPNATDAIRACRRLLKTDGVLVASVPVTPSVDVNPYHQTDFSRRSFLKMLRSNGFEPMDELSQVQPFSLFKIASGQERRLDDMRDNIPLYYLSHPAAVFKRAWSTLRYGFSNRYLTVACRAV